MHGLKAYFGSNLRSACIACSGVCEPSKGPRPHLRKGDEGNAFEAAGIREAHEVQALDLTAL